MRECMAEGCPHPAAGTSQWCGQHDEPNDRDDYKRHAVALPLATTNANRCDHHRENGHRCALPVGHASEHFYRENGMPWRGTVDAALSEERA